MRVVGGRLRGRNLASPTSREIRPTADRLRESVFNILMHAYDNPIQDARVLDLFAGTGALGIEALSRGAATVVFVERDDGAARILGENLRALAIGPELAQVRRGDVLAALRTARGRGEFYDLVLIDPPYGDAARLGPKLSASLPPLLAPGARVVTESDRRRPLGFAAPIATERRYGDTTITIHTT